VQVTSSSTCRAPKLLDTPCSRSTLTTHKNSAGPPPRRSRGRVSR
jgi:hypothetical protein